LKGPFNEQSLREECEEVAEQRHQFPFIIITKGSFVLSRFSPPKDKEAGKNNQSGIGRILATVGNGQKEQKSLSLM